MSISPRSGARGLQRLSSLKYVYVHYKRSHSGDMKLQKVWLWEIKNQMRLFRTGWLKNLLNYEILKMEFEKKNVFEKMDF